MRKLSKAERAALKKRFPVTLGDIRGALEAAPPGERVVIEFSPGAVDCLKKQFDNLADLVAWSRDNAAERVVQAAERIKRRSSGSR
ncbi:MAG TPA: hypothetical protein VH539_15505 [Gemmatimonadaceae bacterium]|jgi:hypothetical protein